MRGNFNLVLFPLRIQPAYRASSTQRAWQALPRHLRRRAASHDVRRVPLKLRDKARAEVSLYRHFLRFRLVEMSLQLIVDGPCFSQRFSPLSAETWQRQANY
jgi:hypothetical protein